MQRGVSNFFVSVKITLFQLEQQKINIQFITYSIFVIKFCKYEKRKYVRNFYIIERQVGF